jgi:S1-C subfamily serine protease
MKKWWTLSVVMAMLACGPESNAVPAQQRPIERPIPHELLETEKNTIEVFRRCAPSVVFVTNSRQLRSFRGLNVTEIPQGSGSGFIWDELGHVVTNYHVIRGGDAFSVTFGDGTSYDARVVGFDPNKDLAVLRIRTQDRKLVPLQHGDSAELVVGQKVLAIGNPFGLDHTLTTGVISAVGREIPSLAGTLIEDVIQTDASINPGNSGGPLLDSSGRLIGVNTSIVGPAGQSAGIGFAVPSSTVNRIVPQLIRFGKVRRAGLGVRILPDYVAERWGVDGVIVRDLSPGNAAQRAGLQPIRVDRWGSVTSFDLIVGIDDDTVSSYNDLYRALDGRKAGESIQVHFDRSGRRHTTDLVLQEID